MTIRKRNRKTAEKVARHYCGDAVPGKGPSAQAWTASPTGVMRMNHEEENLAKWLKKALPPADETELARQEVLDRLLSTDTEDTQTTTPYEEPGERAWNRRRVLFGVAAVAVASLLLSFVFHGNR